MERWSPARDRDDYAIERVTQALGAGREDEPRWRDAVARKYVRFEGGSFGIRYQPLARGEPDELNGIRHVAEQLSEANE